MGVNTKGEIDKWKQLIVSTEFFYLKMRSF